MLNSKKGVAVGAAILIAVIGVAIVFGAVLYFFYVFKAHATLEAREEYVWNKVQEMPLSLLSMDIDKESFVSKMNKVYYSKEDANQLKTQLNKMIMNQLFYEWYSTTEYPYKYFINVGGFSFSGAGECACSGPWHAPVTGEYKCNSDCGVKAGESCSVVVLEGLFGLKAYVPSNRKCYGKNVTKYGASYPFPLTFNGTDDVINIISYEVIEWRG